MLASDDADCPCQRRRDVELAWIVCAGVSAFSAHPQLPRQSNMPNLLTPQDEASQSIWPCSLTAFRRQSDDLAAHLG
jgi:hypothetical protein